MGESMKLTENDTGKIVEILVGDELEIILPGNPTTGYVWEPVSLDMNKLGLGQAEFFANDKAPGSVGMEIIKLHALAAGTSIVRLIFHRPFEQNRLPLKIFELNLVIKK
ncbi:protease inhibitor I42 family protein [Methylobacter sp. S3L5C]|uniref:protease inhibitor I42 family protein n=1 Tax=Methylobacter sp. S3L5C TaxID=2839024 RepID=UPI001FADF295|nr:protease inhibitor I42 family protein [Methylobacter sp. S3L5C]UOA09550.1 protease inhibitor I42 family protein [Methylobacter sp. S3L5C]